MSDLEGLAADAGGDQRGETVLNECVRVSRLLGADPYLVLHGGGNTSAKDGHTLHVKASGHDLRTIGLDGFAALDRSALTALLAQPAMTDTALLEGLRLASRGTTATPSIETLLHNLLPDVSVLHTHADAIVTLTNTPHGMDLARDVLGAGVVVLPYCIPGFELAKAVQHAWEAQGALEVAGIVLAHHGLFTFGSTASTAYDRHLDLVARASRHVADAAGVTFIDDPDESPITEDHSPELAALADRLRSRASEPVCVSAVSSPQIAEFIARPDVAAITQQGPATLEHVIRTKRVPLLGDDLDAYVTEYQAYFERNSGRAIERLTMLAPLPRIILHPELGLVGTGRTEKDAKIAQDIYRHTIRVITAAEALGGYASITEEQAFDIEYWELEQAKLR